MRIDNIQQAATRNFWEWFAGASEQLREDPQNPLILGDLDRRLREIDPRLSWEVGPGIFAPNQLAISPNLDPAVRKIARSVIEQAPVDTSWEFHSARLPKKWNFRFKLEVQQGGILDIDASSWKFILLCYPDGRHEVLVETGQPLPLSEDDSWQAATVVLESILGEDKLMELDGEYELVEHLEPELAVRARPLQELLGAFSGGT